MLSDRAVPLYEEPLFRPPSEAESLILQITVGCSHNRCGFCSMYRMKSFRAVPLPEVERDIAQAARQWQGEVRRVFLADGDAMCLSAKRLSEVLDRVNGAFPRLQRIGIYANARDVLSKSDDELRALRERRLKILYMGLESGDPETLARIDKGATVDEIVEAVRRAQAVDMSVSVMVLIGLGGRSRSQEHARASAEAINRMEPTYTALLTYTPTPASPLMDEIDRGTFELPDPLESIREIHTFVSGLTCRTHFTCNHASNYVPLKGNLPGARDHLLKVLQGALDGRIGLKPEFLRGL
ncbi:MAG: radical SAM protein [Deltaproteobacteria bacterium]|nr:radical SAM protein [Deltaproteobacteria bacterium]